MEPFDTWCRDAMEEARRIYGEPIGIGRRRATFAHSDGWVIKIPLDDYGVNDNESEWHIFRKRGRTGPYMQFAECRMEYNNVGLPLLIMERLDTSHIPWEQLPSWCKFVDCCQVGIAHDGALLAYDYSEA